MQHCSSCGGALAAGRTDCGYCGSRITLEERGYGVACPECFCRLRREAQYCNSCGVKIAAEVVAQGMMDGGCPRCRTDLIRRAGSGGAFAECGDCGGVWLDEDTFTRTTQKPHAQSTPPGTVSSAGGESGLPTPPPRDPLAYAPCPVCRELMHRKNFAGSSGIVIDWCRGHGYWFDTDELDRILAHLRDRPYSFDPRELPHEQARSTRPYTTVKSVPIPSPGRDSTAVDESSESRSASGPKSHFVDVLSDLIFSIFR